MFNCQSSPVPRGVKLLKLVGTDRAPLRGSHGLDLVSHPSLDADRVLWAAPPCERTRCLHRVGKAGVEKWILAF